MLVDFFWFIVVQNSSVIAEKQAWENGREIVKEWFKKHDVAPSSASEDLISCIGTLTKRTQALLEDHPDEWDNMKKGAFLMETYSTRGKCLVGSIHQD